VCRLVREEFHLPDFEYGSEIDSEWAVSQREGVEFNVTHVTMPNRERVEQLTHGVPDHNYVFVLTVVEDSDNSEQGHWFLDDTIPSFSQRLANLLRAEVNYRVCRGQLLRRP